MYKKKKILIPGGTGFLGYHTCLFFKKKGWTVHSISKSKPKRVRHVKNVKYILCDIADKSKLIKKLDNYYDYIVNLSGYVDHSNNKSILKTHFNGCKNLISIFKKKKLKKFIQIGSSIEYGNQTSPQDEDKINNKTTTYSVYGDAKLKATRYLKNLFYKQKVPITILRLYLVYGPYQEDNRVIPFVIKNCIKKIRFNCSPGNQYRDFLFVEDFVKAIYQSLKSKNSDGEIINIGNGNPIKIKNLIYKIRKLIGYGNPNFSKINFRKDEILKLYPKTLKAKKILNWNPKINLEEGLYKTIKFYKKNEKANNLIK